MTTIQSSYSNLIRLLRTLDWFPPLIARLVTGTIFLESGWGKLHNIEKVVGYFTSLGLPAPLFQAHLVAYTEFLGGAFLILGLATRFAAIPLSITMIVALLTAKRSDISSISDLFSLSEFLYILLFIYLIIEGAGKISLDRIFLRKLEKKSQ